jgi:Flp pilus assembly protein TadD
VYYRRGNFDKASETLQKAAKARTEGPDAWNLLFLAMCYHQLGDAAKARDSYARALRWQAQRQAQNRLSPHEIEVLKGLRSEAASLMGKANS